METQRVWLDRWEWDCCGEPFAVGDQVAFRTDPRTEELTTLLGPALAPSVDRQESHHDDTDRARLGGTVVAIWAVAFGYVERRVPHERPAPSRPRDAAEIQAGAGWIAMRGAGRRYVTVRELTPGSSRLSRIPRVPWPARESEPRFDGQPVPDGLGGYLVDIEMRESPGV